MAKEQRQPAAHTVRYGVRTEVNGRVVEVGIGVDLDEEILFAEQHYAKHGSKIWIRDMLTGRTVHRVPAEARSAGAR